MKRYKSLVALSQDHHHGLKLAMFIKSDSPNYIGLPQTLEGKVQYTLHAWEAELKEHFKNEEELLFPFVRERDDALDIMIDEILIEHEEIEFKIGQLNESDEKKELLNDLGYLLEHHIRKEERELFELIQNNFTEEELENIVEQIIPVKSE